MKRTFYDHSCSCACNCDRNREQLDHRLFGRSFPTAVFHISGLNAGDVSTILSNPGTEMYDGDIKSSVLNTDHGPWIRLDGRPNSGFDALIQIKLINLGLVTGGFLLDATGCYVGSRGAVGTVSGSNDVALVQNNLPDVSQTVTIPAHSHFLAADVGGTDDNLDNVTNLYINKHGDAVTVPDNSYFFKGSATVPDIGVSGDAGGGAFAVSSVNDQAQVNVDIGPQTLNVNFFVHCS